MRVPPQSLPSLCYVPTLSGRHTMLRSTLLLARPDRPAGAPVNHLFCRGAFIPQALPDAKWGLREFLPERAGPAWRPENQPLVEQPATYRRQYTHTQELPPELLRVELSSDSPYVMPTQGPISETLPF
ncbi:hypothetical protein COCON_G00076680 [Conger conger]|uniref:Uncharacterized protein n=1 Tax=Conger conger TaxID=82655 RepID=A0A9Q1I1I9_CONCO|nr:hypothetical protein COCON_G00076680 [Conger conger]